uniref:Uncharacterized protein n=1 Tax=Serinus canaria TaxID=9135 RepID=A0A8C9L426_SERCA
SAALAVKRARGRKAPVAKRGALAAAGLYEQLKGEWGRKSPNLAKCGEALGRLKVALLDLNFLPTSGSAMTKQQLILARECPKKGPKYPKNISQKWPKILLKSLPKMAQNTPKITPQNGQNTPKINPKNGPKYPKNISQKWPKIPLKSIPKMAQNTPKITPQNGPKSPQNYLPKSAQNSCKILKKIPPKIL